MIVTELIWFVVLMDLLFHCMCGNMANVPPKTLLTAPKSQIYILSKYTQTHFPRMVTRFQMAGTLGNN